MDTVERDRLVNFYQAFPAPSRPSASSVAAHQARRLVSYYRAFRVAHIAARVRVLALIASRAHADLADGPAGVEFSTPDEVGETTDPLPQVDVITLVAAPSAPPRLLAHISTSEASI